MARWGLVLGLLGSLGLLVTACAPAAATAPCRVAVSTPLETRGHHLARIYVPVERDGARAALLLDTGSAASFLSLPPGAPDVAAPAGTVDVSCLAVAVIGRPFAHDDTVGGRPVIGTLGADFLLARRTVLDLRRGRLTRSDDDATADRAANRSINDDDATAGWPRLPFEAVQGHLMVRVVVDGAPLRLLLDTGSPDLLWLGPGRQPGDRATTTTDAQGRPLPLFAGTARLAMAGEPPVVVPVLRAPSFPYFEATAASLGGDLQGLLGLSALGARRIVVDAATSTIRLQPR